MSDAARVGLVIVSHSALIADGVVQLAAQMAGDVRIASAGGNDDGGIGTSFERIGDGIAQADGGAGAVILCDLGSAILTAETALDFLDDDQRERVLIADAPIVEGAVAAAVAAQGGDAVDAVLAAAESAGAVYATKGQSTPAPSGVSAAAGYTRSVELRNHDGLHARPAAEFVKLAGTFDATVTVDGISAKSLLSIMGLGLTRGAVVEISSSDDAAGTAAVDALVALVESGFGEA